MNKKKIFLAIIVIGLLFAYFLLLSNILAAPSIMKGVVISDSRILSDDGKTYKVINSESTFTLADCVGKRVEVVGIVEDIEGEIEITLNSFKILTDLPDKRRG